MTLSHRLVQIPESWVVLSGDLHIPEGAKGIVLFVHGSGSSRLSPRNRSVADTLNRHGLATLLFDLLSEEEERIDEKTRELRFDIGLLTDRVDAATRWTSEEADLMDLSIGYFGASTGAAAALRASVKHPRTVKAVVSRGGRPDLAGASLPDVTAPTLLIVGGLDGMVIDLNRQALDHMRCEAKLEVVPGATHLFEEPGTLEQVSALAAQWFEGRLTGRL